MGFTRNPALIMSQKRDKNEIRDMVEDEFLDRSKVMDVSESMRKFDKLKYPLPKEYDFHQIGDSTI